MSDNSSLFGTKQNFRVVFHHASCKGPAAGCGLRIRVGLVASTPSAAPIKACSILKLLAQRKQLMSLPG